MKDRELFKETDDMTIDKISQEFPVLTKEEKERIFAMSEKKYDSGSERTINTAEFSDEAEVTGVERYKRPIWYKYMSIAAAVVLMVGGISGSLMLMNRGSRITPAADPETTVPTETETTETTETTSTEEPTEAAMEAATAAFAVTDGSYEEIAQQLTDRFAELTNKLNAEIQYDPDDVIYFDIDDPQSADGMSYFARVIDPAFQSPEDFYNAFREICTDEFYDRLEENGGFDSDPNAFNLGVSVVPSAYFWLDFSDYNIGDTVDMAEFDYHTEDYLMYKGSLYVRTDYMPYTFETYSDLPELTEEGYDSLRAVRSALFLPACNAEPSKVGNPLTFCIVKDGDCWKINDIIEGANVDLTAEEAVRYYFKEVNTQYTESGLDFDPENIFFEDVEILSHDNCKSMRVYYQVKDSDGNPLLAFSADVETIPNTDRMTPDGYDYHEPKGFTYSNVAVNELY